MEHGIRFGTDGWRGVMSEEFTMVRLRLVAQAIASYLRAAEAKPISLIVAHDTRFLAEQFSEACVGVLAGNGIAVLAPQRAMPTPLVAFAIGECEADGAIMLTASHNPPIYNGIKFIPHYCGPAGPEITSGIEEALGRLDEEDILTADTPPAACDPIPGYREHLGSLVDFAAISGLRIGLDVMYGAGQGIMKDLLVSAGCEVEALHEWRDAFFGGATPEPSEANLAELCRTTVDRSLDLGLALDGDADRFGVVDSTGLVLTSNQVLALVALHLLEDRGMRGRLVRSVATTHLLDSITSHFGVECIETPVGFKYIAAEMLAGGVLLGGEESGGLSIAGHVPEKDGLLADLLVAELVGMKRRPLADILEDTYERFGRRVTRRIDAHCGNEAKRELLASLTSDPPQAIGDLALTEVRTVDGVKYLLDRDAWVLVRPSGTEPLIRAYIEARDERDFETLEGWVTALLEQPQ